MRPNTSSFIIICLITFASVCLAEQTVETSPEPVLVLDLNEVYIGEIVGDEVNIRSGPGTNYYVCTKLGKTDRVKVVSSQFSWSCIEPPVGCFSWISKQYVSIDTSNPGIGIVTGDAVRVYAGSAERQPIHSTKLQGKLNKDDRVKLLGEEQDDYYKIAPPAFAYLWVSTKYIKPIGSVDEVPLIVESAKAESELSVPDVIVPSKLEEFRSLQEKIDAEKLKPIVQQNYTNIKEALLEIANDQQADKVARYAQFTIKQIERYELAIKVGKTLELQQQQLQETKQRVEKARAAKLAQIPDLGRFAAIGNLQVSSIYGIEPELKHYQLIDKNGKIICFALPDVPASNRSLNKFLGKKVGLVGEIVPHPQTAKALVKFTGIVELK